MLTNLWQNNDLLINFASINIEIRFYPMKITKEISIEDLIEGLPGSVEYLMKEGIRCIVCGEPIWGSLQEAAEEKGFKTDDLERFVADLQYLADNPTSKELPVQAKIDYLKR